MTDDAEDTGRPQVLVVVRNASVAHPSFTKGGYIPLHFGATAYRNADFVASDPAGLLEWCRRCGCEITALSGEDPSTQRYRVRFPDQPSYASFRSHFQRS